MKNKIVVVGSSNIDLIMKMERLPAPGETVTEAEFMQVFGGKGANQAVAAARAGGDVAFVNCVGDDANTIRMLDNYREDGIDTSFVFREKDIPSGHALIMIDQKGNNCISVAPGANYRLSPAKIEEAKPVFEEAALIVMQYEILEETIKKVIDIVSEHGIPVMLNFAPAREFDKSYIPKINILVLNEIEAAFLADMQVITEEDAERAAQKLVNEGVEKVIITMGPQGALQFSRSEKIRVPAFRVAAVDTTAAGDTFCGSYAVALVEGKSPSECLQFASAAAAISVTRMGAQPSTPFRNEIDNFLSKNN